MNSQKTTAFLMITTFLMALLQGCSLYRGGLLDTPSLNSQFRDANPVKNGYAELSGSYNSYEFFDTYSVNLQGEVPLNDRFSIGAKIPFVGIEFDDFDEGESGIGDISVWLNYHVVNREKYVVDIGGRAEIPIGAEEVGGNQFDYGFAVSGRYKFSDEFVAHANVGYDMLDNYVPEIDETINIFRGGAGLIYSPSPKINLFGEADFQEDSEFRDRLNDFPFLKGGIGYRFSDQIFGRAVFGTGLRERGPDTFFEVLFRTPIAF